MRASIAFRSAPGRSAQAATTRRKSGSKDANASHSGRQKCRVFAVIASWNFSQSLGTLSLVAKLQVGSDSESHFCGGPPSRTKRTSAASRRSDS